MPLSTRELLLVLRARDEASRVLNGISRGFGDVDSMAARAAKNQMAAGAAMIGVGVGIAATGAAALNWMADSVKMAVEFDNQVAKVATQTDKVKVSQKQLGDVVKSVGKDIAVPIKDLNDALYDIFSSMDVNLPQAKVLLQAFAKEAVAGQVDIQDASRATIGIMNAFHIPVEKVNSVLDIQFQLVRKGVGTFADFSTAIGKVTPSATRAGQSIQTMAGMLAFMTRNGMSAQQASASAARAFDAFSNPLVTSRLEAMGIKVRDAKGEFLDMGSVMVDLQKKLGNLTAPERSEALKKLFIGAGGTIQARRFYDLVLKDQASAQQFVGLVGDMNNASGAFTDAYGVMADTASSKSEVLKNRWELLRIEVGQALMPVLWVLMDVLSKVLGWWSSLSDGTKKMIVYIAAAAAALAVVIGVLLAVAGVFLMISGAAAALGVGVGTLIGIVAGVIAAIAGLILIGYLVIKNWDKIKATATAVGDWIVGVFTGIADWFWDRFGKRITDVWNRIWHDSVEAFTTVRDFIISIWNDIVSWTGKIWPKIVQIIQPYVDFIIGIWDNVKNILKDILDIIVGTFRGAWTMISGILKGAWDIIAGIISGVIDIFKGLVDFVVGVFTGDWNQAWRGLGEFFGGIWDGIRGTVQGTIDIIIGIIKGAAQIIMDIWKPLWDLVKNVVEIANEAVAAAIKWIWDRIVGIFEIGVGFVKSQLDVFARAWNGSWKLITDALTATVRWITDRLRDIGTFFGRLRDTILDALKDAGRWLITTGYHLLEGLWEGINNAKSWLLGKIGSFFKGLLPGWVQKMLGINSPSTVFAEFGKMTILGFGQGMMDNLDSVKDAAKALAGAAVPNDISGLKFNADGTVSYNGQSSPRGRGPGSGTFGIPPGTFGGTSSGTTIINNIGVYTPQIDPERNAADLGFALGRGLGGS